MHSQWRAAYRSGAITKVAATKLKPLSSSHTVDRGLSILHRYAEGTGAESERSISPPRTMHPGDSIRAVCEAGFLLQRGTCTTSDFAETTETDLHAAVAAAENGCESEVGFSLETCYDADDVASLELLCNNCRGPGHISRNCPSPKKYRSFAYVAELNLRALQRVEGAPVKGTVLLVVTGHCLEARSLRFRRGIPKKFQDGHPFRRMGNYGRPSSQVARTADVVDQGSGSDENPCSGLSRRRRGVSSVSRPLRWASVCSVCCHGLPNTGRHSSSGATRPLG
mmetsp:Transcript_18816/g.28339  ORF Transcript_18816/g.28339 Transcript_18816/m.28339 type:complete len:281 (+) Transcript_18816:219-1061(+)